jgi:hypothetical protein
MSMSCQGERRGFGILSSLMTEPKCNIINDIVGKASLLETHGYDKLISITAGLMCNFIDDYVQTIEKKTYAIGRFAPSR